MFFSLILNLFLLPLRILPKGSRGTHSGAGSGAGSGGGSGGSIRDAGGSFGKLAVAQEEEYFRRKVRRRKRRRMKDFEGD